MNLSIAAKVPVTEAEGPGKRFAVWVQGCPFRCPGCCNPQYLSFRSDEAETVSFRELVSEILEYWGQIEGVTFIGGEPFSQAKGLAEVSEELQANGLSVMVFSGYRRAELDDPSHPAYEDRLAFLRQIDLLVDGQYIEEKAITNRRWIGSSNQEVHFLTDRYIELQKQWPSEANTIEIRYHDGKLTINGFPHDEITDKCLDLIKK